VEFSDAGIWSGVATRAGTVLRAARIDFGESGVKKTEPDGEFLDGRIFFYFYRLCSRAHQPALSRLEPKAAKATA
jgi:hypothetical protein